jgi:multiple sugar transport system substrate-binding protein
LKVVRPAGLAPGEAAVWEANQARFAAATGVAVQTDFLGWEDVRAQAAVAARAGAGPDVALVRAEQAQLFGDAALDLTGLAEELAEAHGGWGPLPQRLGRRAGTGGWIAIPMGCAGSALVWRRAWVAEAGYAAPPNELDRFLDLCRKLQKAGRPAGFGLGNAAATGGFTAQWLLWAHGGFQADEAGAVAINRKETVEALKYGAELYRTFVPGTLSWRDETAGRAYSAGEIAVTGHGAGLYLSLKADPRMAAVAQDTQLSRLPGAKGGRAPETAQVLAAVVFRHTPYPNAAAAFLRFMMQPAQYEPFLAACQGALAQPLLGYDRSPAWEGDAKLLAYRDAQRMPYWPGCMGTVSAASAAAEGEYVLVQMFATVCAGQATPQEAAREAERRMLRIYRRAA